MWMRCAGSWIQHRAHLKTTLSLFFFVFRWADLNFLNEIKITLDFNRVCEGSVEPSDRDYIRRPFYFILFSAGGYVSLTLGSRLLHPFHWPFPLFWGPCGPTIGFQRNLKIVEMGGKDVIFVDQKSHTPPLRRWFFFNDRRWTQIKTVFI